MSFALLTAQEILQQGELAWRRIRGLGLRQTALEFSHPLSKLVSNASVFVKMESEQVTGTFKVRGALSKVTSLTDDERKRGIVTASTGNHGLGVSYALRALHMHGTECAGTIFLPQNIKAGKLELFEQYKNDVSLEFFGSDCLETEKHAMAHAESNGKTYISPYNDRAVLFGQATIAVEMLGIDADDAGKQIDKIDVCYVTCGGGGLISGVAGVLKARNPSTVVVGCSPSNSAVMAASVKAGRILDLESLDTLSSSSAGGVDEGSITFPVCQSLVDRWVLVSEEEIKNSLVFFLSHHHKLIEGAAACAVAAFIQDSSSPVYAKELEGKKIVIISCGSNIDIETVKQCLQ